MALCINVHCSPTQGRDHIRIDLCCMALCIDVHCSPTHGLLCVSMCTVVRLKDGVKDGFYLKAEFKYCAIICLVCIVGYNVIGNTEANKTVFPFTSVLLLLTTIGVFTLSSTFPLCMSRRRDMRSSSSRCVLHRVRIYTLFSQSHEWCLIML